MIAGAGREKIALPRVETGEDLVAEIEDPETAVVIGDEADLETDTGEAAAETDTDAADLETGTGGLAAETGTGGPGAGTGGGTGAGAGRGTGDPSHR